MNKKVKIQLAVILGITIILLLTSFALIRAKAKEYMGILDKMAEEDWEWEDVEYGGLTFIAAFTMLFGSMIALLSVPLLATTVVLLPFFIIVLCVKKEETQEIVALVLMILSIIVTVPILLYLASSTRLFAIFAQASSTPMLSYAILAMLILTGLSLVANLITIIVSYARLNNYCKKSQIQQIVNQQ